MSGSVAAFVEAENDLRLLGAQELRGERDAINKELQAIQDNISDLAFNNYRTYADAGRTSQTCTEIFTEMSDKLREISRDVSTLSTELHSFRDKTRQSDDERHLVRTAAEKTSPIWDMLSLPSRMDVCIRAGYYDAAYALTNYGMTLEQHSIIANPLAKKVASSLVESRSFLLNELFHKFSGPLDLATSIQIVNNVRKMPFLTPTQLRLSVLQHRDKYLDKLIMDITSHPEFVVRAIETYRECMYDTLVLYLAVFPDSEVHRKDPSVDPRWEQWPSCAPSVLLGQWATRNIERLLDLIKRADMKSSVDMAAVWSKLMSMAASFGRMSLDFRPLVVGSLNDLVIDRFKTSVRTATTRLVNEVQTLYIASGDIGGFFAVNEDGPPQPSAELSLWDDVCVYGNGLVEALNNLRFSLSPMILHSVMAVVRDSLRQVLSWLVNFRQSASFTRALRIVAVHLAPFLTRCIRFLFPYSVIYRLFSSSITLADYEAYCELNVLQIASECDEHGVLCDALQPMMQRKVVADLDLDVVMKRATTAASAAEPGEEHPSAPNAADEVSVRSDDTADLVLTQATQSYESVVSTDATHSSHGSVSVEQTQLNEKSEAAATAVEGETTALSQSAEEVAADGWSDDEMTAIEPSDSQSSLA